MTDLIQALKDNEKPFGLMSEEMRERLRMVYTPVNLNIYLRGVWTICGSAEWNDASVYRLRPDYKEPEEKPEIVEVSAKDDSEALKLFYSFEPLCPQCNMEHSKLPWKEGTYGGIYPAGDNPPAITSMSHMDGSWRHNAKANTAFIVIACNEHDSLKSKEKLLGELVPFINELLDSDVYAEGPGLVNIRKAGYDDDSYEELIEIIVALLSKAKELK